MRHQFEKLGQSLLRDQAAEKIRRAIIEGKVLPGDKIPEHELAAQFGVSRIPIREAIRMLEQQGLVVTRPRSGTFVRELSLEEHEDGMRVRSSLEELAVEQALERQSPEEWQGMCDMLQGYLDGMHQMAAQHEWSRVVELDLAWHDLIVAAASNRLLEELWQSFGLLVRFVTGRQFLGRPTAERFFESVSHHDELLAALRRRDLAECRAAVRTHALRYRERQHAV